jgi:DNA-binding CsgD family transcriptional regulator
VLDKREATIIRALIRDGTAAGAGQTLGLSTRHIRRLLRTLEARLGVGNTHALVAAVVAAGLVDPPSGGPFRGHRSAD